MKTISSLQKKNIKGKNVLVRLDLNVHDEDIRFSLRVVRAIETIQHLRLLGARVIILSHRGRPTKKEASLSLKPFKDVFKKSLKEPVVFIDDIATGKTIIQKSKASIFLCENLRFWKGEEKNSDLFAKQLAHLGDWYVNDAFANSHRTHASICAITKYIPAYAGPVMEQEIFMLRRVMRNPHRPLVAVLGGAKVSDKILLLRWFKAHADLILTGGGIANTFLAWCGYDVGDSIREKADSIRSFVKDNKFRIPKDTVVYKNKILDIGTHTIQMYMNHIAQAGSVVWNGPMGDTDVKQFCIGSRAIWNAIRKQALLHKDFYAVVGGGETTAFVLKEMRGKKIPSRIFLSTGGGAMLEFLSGKKLPGIEVLK